MANERVAQVMTFGIGTSLGVLLCLRGDDVTMPGPGPGPGPEFPTAMFHGNIRRQGSLDGIPISDNPTVDWEVSLSFGEQGAYPVPAGDIVMTIHPSDGLIAVDKASGEILWNRANIRTRGAPAVSEGRIFTTIDDDERGVIALDTEGQTIWENSLDELSMFADVRGRPAVGGGRVYYPGDSRMIAVDPGDGSLIWETQLHQNALIDSAPGYHEGSVYVTDIDQDNLWELDGESGEITKSMSAPTSGIRGDVAAGAASIGEGVATMGGFWGSSGKVWAFDVDTGEMVDEFLTSEVMHSAVAISDDGVAYIVNQGNMIQAAEISPRGFNFLWGTELPGSVLSAAVVTEDRVYVATRNGHILGLDLDGNIIFDMQRDIVWVGMRVEGGQLFASSFRVQRNEGQAVLLALS